MDALKEHLKHMGTTALAHHQIKAMADNDSINGNAMAMENLSSTAELTSAKQTKSEEALGEYDPFAHRVVDKPTSDSGALAHLLKSSLGSGILAMPMAFKNGGLTFGMIMTVAVGFVCTHCVQMLVESSHVLCRRMRTPVLDFAETTYVAFQNGPPSFVRFAAAARTTTTVALSATYLMTCTVYVVFVSTTIQKIIRDDNAVESWQDVDIRIYILMIWLPLLILCIIKDLKYLVPFSMTANGCIVGVFGITLYYMFSEIKDPADRVQMGNYANLPAYFSTVIFAMEGVGVVMPLENSMKNPTHFIGCPGVLNTGMGIVVLLYAVIGFFGYLRFGECVEGTITLNLDSAEIPAQICQYLIAIAIFFTYALQFYIPTTIIWKSIKGRFPENRHLLYYYVMRFVLVTGTVLLAIAVPNLGPIINLVGAICFSLLGLTLPTIIHIATRYAVGNGYGKFKWILWKDIIIVVLSLLALIFGTYSSINDIIVEYSGSSDDNANKTCIVDEL